MSGVGKNDERFEFYFDCFVFFYDFCRRIKQRYDSMENTGKIFGISLGPGDPELITLKALKALNAVEVIFLSGDEIRRRADEIPGFGYSSAIGGR